MGQNKPRWEVQFEKYLSEEPVSKIITKIKRREQTKMNKLKKELEALKNEKVEGSFKTKEEYQAAVNAHKEKIEAKEMEIKEYSNPEADKELEGYKNYQTNKDKINNILEYRKELEAKLSKLPKDYSEEMGNKKKELDAVNDRVAQYQREIEEMKKELKANPKMQEEDKQIFLYALKVKMDAMGVLQENQTKLDREMQDIENAGKAFDKTIESKKLMYERKIAKCNILAANLLKGKNIDDIELNVEQAGKKLMPKDEKSKKILESAREENEENLGIRKGKPTSKYEPEKEEINKENTELTEVSDFAKKHPRLAKIANFFKKIKNWFVYEDEYDIEDNDNTNKEIGEEVSKILKNKKELDKEDLLLKQIAKDGKEKTFKDKYKANVKEAADRLAAKYGGIYEKQDGATAKKQAKVEKEEITH